MLYKLAAYKNTDNAEVQLTAAGIDFSKPIDEQVVGNGEFDPKKEITQFETYCDACGARGDCRMCVASIPYFTEIIIMAFSCEVCGHRSAEIK